MTLLECTDPLNIYMDMHIINDITNTYNKFEYKTKI